MTALKPVATPSTPTPLLDVRGLRISFAGQEVVHGINFSITPGEKLALVGESGSGKTVTALSLLRLVQNAEVVQRARAPVLTIAALVLLAQGQLLLGAVVAWTAYEQIRSDDWLMEQMRKLAALIRQ